MANEAAAIGYPQKMEGLEIHPLGDQVTVYEPEADRIHYLNPTAALILEFCDGDHSPEQIAALLQEAYGLPAAPLSEVGNCVAEFKLTGIVR